MHNQILTLLLHMFPQSTFTTSFFSLLHVFSQLLFTTLIFSFVFTCISQSIYRTSFFILFYVFSQFVLWLHFMFVFFFSQFFRYFIFYFVLNVFSFATPNATSFENHSQFNISNIFHGQLDLYISFQNETLNFECSFYACSSVYEEVTFTCKG